MPATENRVRHAVSRTTGATTLARKIDEKWLVQCMNHGAGTEVASRSVAWTTASHPAKFCATCKQILAGQADRITEGLIAVKPILNTPPPSVAKRTSTPKSTTRSQAYVTKTGERRVRPKKTQGEN